MPTVVIITGTSKSGTVTVPAGVTSAEVECWGRGYTGYSGSGGGGGAYARSTITVTPGASISYSIDEERTSWNGGAVLAKASISYIGGSAGSSVGTIKYSGGRGSSSGGGGASASPTGTAPDASSSTGSSSPGAGAGGTSNNPGQDSVEGGGGGGQNQPGGNPGGGGGGGSANEGGYGQIRITWIEGAPAPTRKAPRSSYLA